MLGCLEVKNCAMCGIYYDAITDAYQEWMVSVCKKYQNKIKEGADKEALKKTIKMEQYSLRKMFIKMQLKM